MLQNDFRSVNVGFDRMNRLLDDQLHADRRRQVDDDVCPIDEFSEDRLVGYRVDGVVEFRIVFEMDDVVDRPGRQVVDNEHFVAAIEECFGKVAPDESRATCNQYPHQSSFLSLNSVLARAAPARWLAGANSCDPASLSTASAARAAAPPSDRMANCLKYSALLRSICRRNSSSYRIRRSAGSMSDRVAAPAIVPADTNGERLFGRPMTSAGIPRTPASIATVELTVTTTRLARSNEPSGTAAARTLMFLLP